MSSKDLLQDGMNALSRLLGQQSSSSATRELREVYDTSVSFKYKPDNTTSGGFQSLASADRDIVSSVEGSVPNQIQKSLGVVKLDPSAKSADLIKDVGSDETDLTAITGDSRLSSDGFLDVAVSAPFPEALAEVVKSTTTSSSSEVKTIVGNNVSTELARDDILDNVLGDVLNTKKGTSNKVINAISNQNNSRSKLLNNSSSGFNGTIENLVETTFQSTEVLLNSVAKKGDVTYNVPPEDVKDIVTSKNNGDIDNAVKILKKYSDKSDADLKNVILKIDNRASTVLEPAAVSVHIPSKRTDDYNNVWREATTDINSKIFDPIADITELETELANMTREVTEVIVEAFATVDGSTTTVEEWHQLYVDKYDQGFEPHYYINYAGVLFRGRPVDIKGTGFYYSGVPDHSERSILIALEEPNYMASTAQMNTIRKMFQSIFNVKPGVQVFGIHDIIRSTESPWWNVSLNVKNVFGKENIKDYNPNTTAPLTQKQLVDGYVGN
jgi:hypothetical protein|tara:strand:+ start:8857 stop:10350 length:1494 start_codon:yes stop_codon:yes gene_type:complete